MFAMQILSQNEKYGAVVINSCSNLLRTQNIINNIFSGSKEIWSMENEEKLDPTTIVAIISGSSSGTALQVCTTISSTVLS